MFDILHQEHITFLRKAKELGGRLLVGIESDVRVREIKGEGRPINSQEIRKRNLEELSIADKVFVLPEQFETDEEHLRLLQKIKPDILAVSSHTPHLAEKERLLSEIGGRVVIVHEHNPAVSTTKILQRQCEEI